MATAAVHCTPCNVDTTFDYPDDFAGTDIRWEHSCGWISFFIVPVENADVENEGEAPQEL